MLVSSPTHPAPQMLDTPEPGQGPTQEPPQPVRRRPRACLRLREASQERHGPFFSPPHTGQFTRARERRLCLGRCSLGGDRLQDNLDVHVREGLRTPSHPPPGLQRGTAGAAPRAKAVYSATAHRRGPRLRESALLKHPGSSRGGSPAGRSPPVSLSRRGACVWSLAPSTAQQAAGRSSPSASTQAGGGPSGMAGPPGSRQLRAPWPAGPRWTHISANTDSNSTRFRNKDIMKRFSQKSELNTYKL